LSGYGSPTLGQAPLLCRAAASRGILVAAQPEESGKTLPEQMVSVQLFPHLAAAMLPPLYLRTEPRAMTLSSGIQLAELDDHLLSQAITKELLVGISTRCKRVEPPGLPFQKVAWRREGASCRTGCNPDRSFPQADDIF
jgi:hypothetical protein